MKIIQMMGPSRPKGGEWALETAPGAATRPARTLGTVVLLPNVFCAVCFSSVLALSSPSPSPGKGNH